MNTAVNALVLSQLNSFGVVSNRVFVPAELTERLNKQFEFCKLTKTTCYVTDNKTGLQFVVNRDGIQLFTKHIDFQGPCLPVAKKQVHADYVHKPSEIYSSNKFKGD